MGRSGSERLRSTYRSVSLEDILQHDLVCAVVLPLAGVRRVSLQLEHRSPLTTQAYLCVPPL
jgi:hypothetical protein